MLMVAGGGEACSDIEHLRGLCCVVGWREGLSDVGVESSLVGQVFVRESLRSIATRSVASIRSTNSAP